MLRQVTLPLDGTAVLFHLNAMGAVGAAFTDSVFAIKGSSDATKLGRFEVDGFTTATTRVFTLPNADVVVSGSAAALTSGRVPYATTGGLLTDDAGLTYSATAMAVGLGTGAMALNVNGANATNRDIGWQTAGSIRWRMRVTSNESGSDAGSTFNLSAYTDAGANIDTPVSILRVAAGAITLARPVTLSTASDGLTIAKTTGTTLVVSSTAASTTPTSGSATYAGGVGIAGSQYVGGSLVVGASSQDVHVAGSTITPEMQVNDTSAGGTTSSNTRWANSANGPSYVFGKSRGAAVGTHAVVSDGDFLGRFAFNGSDGSQFREAARIIAEIDGATISSTSMPGRIVFLTTPSGSVNPAEAMRINAAGTVVVTASTTTRATIRVPHGAAPTSPVDGDFWTTTAGAFIRINGVTKTFTLT